MTSGHDLEHTRPDPGREFADAADGPYRELMATYVALGELLDSGRVDADLGQDCRDLVRRLVKLGEWMEWLGEQQWALWMARNTVFGGDA